MFLNDQPRFHTFFSFFILASLNTNALLLIVYLSTSNNSLYADQNVGTMSGSRTFALAHF